MGRVNKQWNLHTAINLISDEGVNERKNKPNMSGFDSRLELYRSIYNLSKSKSPFYDWCWAKNGIPIWTGSMASPSGRSVCSSTTGINYLFINQYHTVYVMTIFLKILNDMFYVVFILINKYTVKQALHYSYWMIFNILFWSRLTLSSLHAWYIIKWSDW